jgi:hypothetical protein
MDQSTNGSKRVTNGSKPAVEPYQRPLITRTNQDLRIAAATWGWVDPSLRREGTRTSSLNLLLAGRNGPVSV